MKHNYLKFTLLAALVMMTVRVSAAGLDADAARSRAASFLKSHFQDRLSGAADVDLRLAHAEPSSLKPSEVDYYVFNTSDGNAFIIVSGEDRVKPILGYGNGALEVERLPSNVRWWLDEYKRQIEWLRAQPEESLVAAAQPKDAPDDDFTVEPLLTCHWDQDWPYDELCPVYENELCLTGCVATAMAQIMYYWKYPDELPALMGYLSPTLHVPYEELPPVVLDWDNMLDRYVSGSYTNTQSLAVATLMRYCAQACITDCSPSGSGSSICDMMIALKQFGYCGSARFMFRDQFSSEEWREMVNSDLKAQRPVSYAGSDGYGGHAFVIDGYSDGLYHVNWGWGGNYDGFFELDLLEYYPGYAFEYNHRMIYQLYPDDGNVSDMPPTFDFEVDGIYYKKTGDEAMVSCRDESYASYQGDVEIPREVTFEGVTYPVTAVDSMAFMGSVDLTSVKMPFIQQIGMSAFLHCTNLREVTLGKSLKTAKIYAFDSSISLERVNIEDVSAWVSVDFYNYPSNPVYYAKHLYCNGQELTDVVINGDVEAIKNYAFTYCEGLKSVTIGEGVTSIGSGAFESCTNLEKVTIPDGMRQVGYCAFYECHNLSDLEFKGSVGRIDDYAFDDCGIQGDLHFPSKVDTIGCAAFANCDGIEKLIVHDLGYMDNYAFAACHGLKSVAFEGQVGRIGFKVFDESPSISRLEVPDLKIWLGIEFDNANCNPLQQVRHLYVGDEELNHVVVPPGVDQVHDYAFVGCECISSAVIGNDVTAIGDQAFYRCTNLAKVSLGDGVKKIGKQAFGTCTSLKHVSLGRGVDSIGSKAFNASMVITDIVCRGATPPVMEDKACFSQTIYKNALLRVPYGSLEAYKNADFWSQFVKINEMGDVNGDGEVNISDVSAIIDIQLSSANDIAADVNADGEVNITDINAVIDIILSGN